MSGAVLGLKLQPYEAHIPYLLQFKIDMNVYGMGHLVCRAVQFRKDPPMHPGHQPPAGWRHTQTQPVARTVTDAPGAVRTFCQLCNPAVSGVRLCDGIIRCHPAKHFRCRRHSTHADAGQAAR